MTHYCEICNYKTNYKYNYDRHLLSKSHKTLVVFKDGVINHDDDNIKFKCNNCGKIFVHLSGLSRHKKLCKIKTNNSNNNNTNEIKDLKDKVANLTDLTKQLVEYIKINTDLTNKNSNIINKTINNNNTYNISIKNYIQKNYSNAPHLQPLTDYTLIEKIEPLLIQFKDDDMQFIDVLISKYKSDILAQYLGDFIVKFYKKDNPAQQSVWNSDTSRLTYIVKHLLGNKIKSEWLVDKKGVKICEYIIDPLLEYISKVNDAFINQCCDRKVIEEESEFEMERRIKNQRMAVFMLKDIKEKKISKDIIKYIAPYFYLSLKDSDNIDSLTDKD